LLHLLFPDRFERIASGEHKRKIVDAFAGDAAGTADLDDAILAIRHAIEERSDRPGFDFYDEPDLFATWNPNPKQADELDFAALRTLIERAYPEDSVRKTCLSVLADSIERAHAVSPASWSLNPRRGQNNLRLNVGSTQACVLGADDLYLVLDRDHLASELQQRVNREMAGADRSGPAYPGTPFAYGAHLAVDRLDELLPWSSTRTTPTSSGRPTRCRVLVTNRGTGPSRWRFSDRNSAADCPIPTTDSSIRASG
jgi:hypothetical protein